MKKSLQANPYAASKPIETPRTSRYAAAAACIKAGMGVSQDFVDGAEAEEIVARGFVSIDELRPYHDQLLATRAARTRKR